MKKKTNSNGINYPSPRTFTFSQLSKISDDNYEVLNRCIDMSFFNTGDIFVLNPVMIHNHAFGKEVDPHLRTIVTTANKPEIRPFQDLTFEQWEQGMELLSNAS